MTAVAVHHVVTGHEDAPVVVLSNSLGSTHTMWDAQAEALAEHFRLVRYDTRGHGQSPVPAGPSEQPETITPAIISHLTGAPHESRQGRPQRRRCGR